jgi:hypothetical protein
VIKRNLKLRYYLEKYPKDHEEAVPEYYKEELPKKHKKVLSLLAEVKKKYGMEYEIYEFPEQKERWVYDNHFLPRQRALKNAVGESIPKALRTRKGYIHINGLIALVEDHRVVWFNDPYNRRYRDGERWERLGIKEGDYAIGFLKALLGIPNFLNEVLERVKIGKRSRSEHDRLIDEFVEKLRTRGEKVSREVEVTGTTPGIPIPSSSERSRRAWGTYKGYTESVKSTYMGGDKIDIVWDKGKETFAIEAKVELSEGAVEQAARYKRLYRIEHPGKDVKSGILCRRATNRMLQIARREVDNIFFIDEI